MIPSDPPKLNPPVSITLARRLVEVADSYRHFTEVYLVAEREFPKNPEPQFPDTPVFGFSSLEGANFYYAEKALNANDWGIFGPYLIPPNDKPVKWDLLEVEHASLCVHFKNEPQDEIIELDKETDAVFLNLSAFDKFAVPYYTRIYGVAYATKLRAYILGEYENKGFNGLRLLAIQHPRTRLITSVPNNS